jgi:arylsulfatase A
MTPSPTRILPLLLLSTTCFAADAPRPNILYFFVDDMGWGSIGPNGQAERRAKGLPNVKTPNIDKLATQGINFTRGYGCTVCSPSRSSQQTGFHQGHTFADRNDPDNAKKAIRADDITMGDALSAAGYNTGYWGKWGYGGSKELENPQILNVQTLPTSHGYHHVLVELHHVRAHTFFQPTLWSAPAPEGSKGGIHLVPNTMAKYIDNQDYPEQPSNHNHPDYPTTGYCDDHYCFQALDFVRKGAKAYNETKKPFFGLLAVQIPHAPFQEIQKLPGWDNAYLDDPHFPKLSPQARQWAAMVTRIDAHFGNLLAALEDPNSDGDTSDSVADNTLVLFQSDNGGPKGANNTELDANGGLRGNKGSIYEGGIRVPTLMRWPAKIHPKAKLKPGSNYNRPVDITDLLPTFCELAGAEIPLGIDGVSLAPTLTGEGYQRPRDFLIHEAANAASIIRGNLKLVRSRKGNLELYDLGKDPAETTNIADGNAKLVKELGEILTAERVDEPKGFAVTYHEWNAEKIPQPKYASQSKNWSEYIYENEGIRYLTDDSSPKASWIANLNGKASASATSKIEFLALEVQRGSGITVVQKEGSNYEGNVYGRNEIRIHGEANLMGGSLSSDRWVEVHKFAQLIGTGTINGNLYNSGRIFVSEHQTIRIAGNFTASEKSDVICFPNPEKASGLIVEGHAQLDGDLFLCLQPGIQDGKRISILTAQSITGKFSNLDDVAESDEGTKFKINYGEKDVTLTVIRK